MLKQLHKVIVYSLVLCFVTFTPTMATQDTIPVVIDNTTNEEINFTTTEINVKDIDIDPLNTQEVKKDVIPDTKKESKKVIGLFLKTMAAVAFCSIILYVILIFVKKYYRSAFVTDENDDFEAFDLSIPENKEDALKGFLNRTK